MICLQSVAGHDGYLYRAFAVAELGDVVQSREEGDALHGVGHVIGGLGRLHLADVRADFDMDYLEALVELFPTCEAVYSLNTGKLILADTVRNREFTGLDRFIHYIVNARFFKYCPMWTSSTGRLGWTRASS